MQLGLSLFYGMEGDAAPRCHGVYSYGALLVASGVSEISEIVEIVMLRERYLYRGIIESL